VEALRKLETAVQTSSVRNASAYLAGVIRRLAQLPTGPGAGLGGGYEADLPLVPRAHAALEALHAGGLLERGALDAKSLRSLAGKPAEVQVAVMETFRDRNLHGIRNMAAFFTSHQTQVERDLREGTLAPPRLGPGDAGGGGPPPHYLQQQGGYHGGPPPPQQHGAYVMPPQGAGYGAPPPQQQAYAYGAPPYQQQQGGPPAGAYGAPPPGIMQQQQGPPPGALGMQQAPVYAPMAAAAAAGGPAGAPPPKHFALEQVQWGVRVDEFQGLSPLAKFVHPAAALRLQQLWDVDQNKMVSVLNEASWEALAGLDAQGGVAAVEETAEGMKAAPDDLPTINSIFLRAASKFPRRADAPTLASLAAPAAAAAPAAMMQAPYGAGPAMQGGAMPLMQAAPYGAPPQQAFYPPAAQQAPLLPQGGPFAGPPGAYGGGPPPMQMGPPGGGYGGGPLVSLPGPAGSLPQAVQVCIDRTLAQWGGMLTLDHFDAKCIEMLHRLGEGTALRALDEFGRNNPSQMRNITAYLIGCLRKYDKPDAGGGAPGGRGGGFGPERHGGRQGGDRFGGRGGGGGRGGPRGDPRDGGGGPSWEPKRYEPY
jgi:hypothetical protein